MRRMNLVKKSIMAVEMMVTLIVLGVGTVFAAVDAQEAEEIALADADIKADQADRLRTEAEREDGENVYEVTFTVDGVEYEYLIREEDGTILEWEMDGRDIGDAAAEKSLKDSSKESSDADKDSAENTDTVIGLERAKEIALSDAGLDLADVSFSKIKFGKEDREVVYEVEFYQARDEFEYIIEAYSGEILKMERD